MNNALADLPLRLAVWLQLVGHDLVERAETRRASLERGQGMVEYGIILGVISVAAIIAILALGPKIKAFFEGANNAIP
jgi:pilus assembly protein Flp/PilA